MDIMSNLRDGKSFLFLVEIKVWQSTVWFGSILWRVVMFGKGKIR